MWKVYVRPDWIYMRVISLDRPWKGHQSTAIGFDFKILLWNIWKISKFWAASCKNESNLLLVWIMVCIGLLTCILWKNPTKCCSILVWIARCWKSLLTNRNSKNNCWHTRIFGAWLGGKKSGLSTYKLWSNKQEVGFIFAWSGSELWTLIKYSISKIKNKKTYSRWCPFEGLSTLIEIQSGVTVPLNKFLVGSSRTLLIILCEIMLSEFAVLQMTEGSNGTANPVDTGSSTIIYLLIAPRKKM